MRLRLAGGRAARKSFRRRPLFDFRWGNRHIQHVRLRLRKIDNAYHGVVDDDAHQRRLWLWPRASKETRGGGAIIIIIIVTLPARTDDR